MSGDLIGFDCSRTGTVMAHVVDGRVTAYWEPKENAWVPVITSKQISSYVNDTLQALAADAGRADDYKRNEHR